MQLEKNNSLILSAQNLKVKRAGKKIIDDVSMSINKNDFITIIGPNGAGKSMLLKCLLGFYKPDSGKIWSKKNIRIGYVPQRLEFNYTLPINAKDFVLLGKNVKKEVYEKVIIETEIEHILDTQISALSGGQMQRVLLARSLLVKPELLILDEPVQNLDIKGQLNFYKLLQKIYEENCISILMVSHDLHMVMSCSNHVICLYHHICCCGTPKNIMENSEFTNLFGDDMKNMMSFYQHK